MLLHRCVSTCADCSSVFGLTAYSAAIPLVVARFNQNPNDNASFIPVTAISGFSVYLFGIFFAPITTPHISEKFGRSKVYLVALPLNLIFNLSAAFSPTFLGVAYLRFLAGYAGGMVVVLLEGTLADMWSPQSTNTYYAVNVLAQMYGAGLGPIVAGFLLEISGDWRWVQFAPAILVAVAIAFILGISETYQREIPRRRAHRRGDTSFQQDPALSGVTLKEQARVTIIDSIRAVFTDPITMLSTIFVTFNFAVVLQWFITVPVALGSPPPAGPGFSISEVGTAFSSALVGATGGVLAVAALDRVPMPRFLIRSCDELEHRILPAIPGSILVSTALFWIGSTVGNPAFVPLVPISGTAVFVAGVTMNLASVIPYLFDAFRPAGTLSALTAAACTRVLFAGALPLVILHFFTAVTPPVALYILGGISIALWAVPAVLLWFGGGMRERSFFAGAPGHGGNSMKAEVPAQSAA